MDGLILAAGYSSRFNSMNKAFKKYFLKLNNSNILSYIIAGMIKTGIKKINIVTNKISNKSNYKHFILKSIKKSGIELKNFKLNLIENKFPERENGYSLLLGLNKISSEYVLLSMADHIFSKNIFSRLKNHYKGYDVLLATDPILREGYYDLDDATKVYGNNSFIIDIGKEVINYNRLDMGVFTLKTKIIRNISQTIESNFQKFGVTDMILLAIESDLNVCYFDFPHMIWLDVDNYAIYSRLKRLFNNSSNLYPFGLDHTGFVS